MTLYTPNHPGEELLLDAANYVLSWLGFSPSTPATMPQRDLYYTAIQLPVHPDLDNIFSLS